VSSITSVMLATAFGPSEGDCVFSKERSTPTSVNCKAIDIELFADVERSTPTSVDCKAIKPDLFADVPVGPILGPSVGKYDGDCDGSAVRRTVG
jgi:hypothetical protein